MNRMKEKKTLIKKYIFHFIALFILIVYLLSADLLFTQFFMVNGESRIVTTDLPAASKDIRYSIDHIYDDKIEWKDMITITGWGFIDNQSTENCSIFLVFSGNNSRYIFKTSPTKRPDITNYFNHTFEPKLNLDNSGFRASICKFLIENGDYKIGILIDNQTAQKYITTKNFCSFGNCSIIDSRIKS